MQSKPKKKKVYLLKSLPDAEVSVWSNLKKLHKAIKTEKESFISYVTLTVKIKESKEYRYVDGNVVRVIEVKEIQ